VHYPRKKRRFGGTVFTDGGCICKRDLQIAAADASNNSARFLRPYKLRGPKRGESYCKSSQVISGWPLKKQFPIWIPSREANARFSIYCFIA